MEKTWMSTTAGILAIIAGAIQLVTGIALAVGLGLLGFGLMGLLGTAVPAWLLSLIGVPWIILGIVAIVGGVHALRRKIWGLALAGSICAVFHPITWFLGIAAIVFVILGRGEFK